MSTLSLIRLLSNKHQINLNRFQSLLKLQETGRNLQICSYRTKTISFRQQSLHYFKQFSDSHIFLQNLPRDISMITRMLSVQSSNSSVWKSSLKQVSKVEHNDQTDFEQIFSRQILMDTDLSQLIKKETPLYELNNYTLYRVLFVLVIMNYIFWTFCANLLYMFYAGVDADGNRLRNLHESKKEKNDDTSFIRTWFQNIGQNSRQTLIQGGFFMIGNITTIVVMYVLTRCVSFVRLMPGGKDVKLGTLNIFGGSSPNRYKIISLSDLSSMQHREQKVTFLTLRARGEKFIYLIDTDGRFMNKDIYDQTIGMQRNLN